MTTKLSPLDFLLSLAIPTWPKCFQTIATHVLIAARLALARKWNNTQSPNIQEVISILNNNLKMEYSFSKAKLTTENFYKIWDPWLKDPRSIQLE